MHPNAWAGGAVTISPGRVGFVVRPVSGHDEDAEVAGSLAELLDLIESWYDGSPDGSSDHPFDFEDDGADLEEEMAVDPDF